MKTKYKRQLVLHSAGKNRGWYCKYRMLWHDTKKECYYQTKQNNRVIWRKVKHLYRGNWILDNDN